MKKWNNLSVNMKRLLITLFAVPAIFFTTITMARRDLGAIVTDDCIGCGACEAICPSVFYLDENGQAHARYPIFADEENDAKEAAKACPVDAIYLNY